MFAAIPASDTVAAPPAAAVPSAGVVPAVGGARRVELRASVTAVVSPVAGPVCVRYSTGLLRLVREAGQVTGSVRQAAERTMAPIDHWYRLAERSVEEAVRALARTAETGREPARRHSQPLRPQSLLVTAGPRLRALARLESPVGPLLAGGAGPMAMADLRGALAALRAAVPASPGTAAPGWTGLPVVLHPPVAAVLLAGVRLLLGGAHAARLHGRRVLPDLTLVDRPVEHPENTLDDRGAPAVPHTIVRSGRVLPLPPGAGPAGTPAAGTAATTAVPPAGRAVWRHESGRAVTAPVFGLTLTGAPAEPVAGPVLELVACVEGLRRYHTDGHLRMLCLARTAGHAGTFLVSVRARPLSMLRAVTGLTGDSVNTYLEHEINTPSLVLPSADELARKCHVLLTSV